ncbi:tape measure protein [Epilithonimonas xixisoli]|nr:tape measure protein [Epilithonimonas xixisoli]
MSNIVEFVVKMKDMMSGGLGKLSSTSQSAFGKMAQHADKMSQRNKILSSSYDELQKKIKAVETQIRTSGSGSIGVGGVAVGAMMGNAGLQIATAFLGAVQNGIGSAISGSLQKEKDIVGLSTFIGKEGAQNAYMNIRKDAENTSYGTESLLKANRALISVDGNAKNAREDVMNLANAIAATGGGNDELMRMAINMQQIKSLGKASSADIKQFGYAGINIYSLLSKATGKTMDEVKEMDVTYDLLAKSLAMARSKGGIYEGALEAQNATKGGRWEAMKDMATNTLTDIGDAMSPIIIQFLDLGQKALSYVAPAILKITPYISMISDGLAIAINYVTGLAGSTGGWMDYVHIIAGILGTVWSVLKSALTTVFKIVGGILDWLGKSQIIKDVFSLIGWTLEKVIKPTISWLGDALVWIWENVLRPILDGLETAYKWVRDLITDDDNELTVEAKKTIINKDDTSQPSYQADLTRFKDKGIIGDTDAKSKKNKESSKKTGDTITGGGQRIININVGKFFDSIQFTTLNNNESREELEKLMMELFGRVLFNGAKNA